MSRPLRALRRRRPRPVPGDEPLEIDRLISPLRYDVVVRQQFFGFVARHVDRYHRDEEGFLELAEREPYYAWFRAVAFPRIAPGAVVRGAGLAAAFRERVAKTVRLHRSFQEHGFDPRHPIGIRSAGAVATTATGKALTGRRFPGDGCHRLALLRSAGHLHLPPEWYRLQVDRRWQPPDNTATLIPLLGVGADAYFSFLSLGYARERLADEASLVAHVAAVDPGRVTELRQIVALDAAVLRSRR